MTIYLWKRDGIVKVELILFKLRVKSSSAHDVVRYLAIYTRKVHEYLDISYFTQTWYTVDLTEWNVVPSRVYTGRVMYV